MYNKPVTHPADQQESVQYPMAPEQEGLWFIQQMAPQNAAYNVVFAVRLTGAVHQEDIRQSLALVVARHPALRTSFCKAEGKTMQHTSYTKDFTFEYEDLNGLNEEAVMARVRELSQAPFDLQAGAPFRSNCLKTADQSHLLILTTHHIAMDLWSLGTVFKDFARALPLVMGGESVSFDALPASYQDHVTAQELLMKSEQGEAMKNYWHQFLGTYLPVMDLPTDHTRPALQSYRGSTVPITLDAELSKNLQELAKQQRVTLYQLILASYQTLLFRYSGQERIMVGSPMAGRTRREFQEVVGNFVNTVVMKADIDPAQSFASLLQTVKADVIGAIKNQSYPFSQLVRDLQPERDPSRPPLVQVGFAWERLPQLKEFNALLAGADNSTGLQMENYSVWQQEGQYDLNLEMGAEKDGELTGYLKYNSDIFERSTVERMAAHFEQLLRSAVANAEQAIGALPMMTAAEATQILKDWNATAVPFDEQETLHGLFEAQAIAHPDNTALQFAGKQWSYSQLQEMAEQVAAYIIGMGYGKGDYIGIATDRSAYMMAALLGVLKSGAAYIPLDPAFPAERLSFMIEDSGLKAILSIQELAGDFAGNNVPVIALDSKWEEIAKAQAQLPAVSASDEAYIIYTSGSTGKPKGVQVGHRSVVNFMQTMGQKPGITASDKLLSVTTLSFDISVLELFLPLSHGACVILVDRDTAKDSQALAKAIAAEGTTIMQATPSTWRMLIQGGWEGQQNLKVLTGGEALPQDLADSLCDLAASVWNMYGPTETTIWSATWQVIKGQPVSIGRPIANTSLYVLDAMNNPVPVGVPGELHIGGSGLALGYLNRPELTAERFVENPFGESPKMYKTGDLVKFTPSGEISYLGRLDNQVKIRGFRIELGEIENVLASHSNVRQAAVKAVEFAAGDKRLVAYYVAEGEAVKEQELRNHLGSKLPEYMVPGYIVAMEAFPTTPNGKVDYKALPRPELNRDAADIVAARDTLELALVNIWEEALGVKPIGVTDNFFNLGGHSLLAVNIMNAIEQEFGKELPVNVLFQNPTIEQLGEVVRKDQGVSNTPLVPIKQQGDQLPLFLPHPIGGNVFCYVTMSRYLSTDQPIYGLQSPSIYDDSVPHVSVEDMAADYIEEIRKVQPSGPYHLAGWCFGGVISYEIARQLKAAGEEVAMLAMFDTRAPLVDDQEDFDDADLLSWFARDLAVPYGKSLKIEPETLRAQEPENMFGYVLERGKEIKVLPEDADYDQLYRYFQVYIANAIALNGYDSLGYDGRINLVLAKDEPEIPALGKNLGWDRMEVKDLQILEADGDHSTIMYDPNVQHIAQLLQGWLDDAHHAAERRELLIAN